MVALPSVIYVCFINEMFKGSHIGLINGLHPYKVENISLDFVALKYVCSKPKIAILCHDK